MAKIHGSYDRIVMRYERRSENKQKVVKDWKEWLRLYEKERKAKTRR